jgi:hypothetical protein
MYIKAQTYSNINFKTALMLIDSKLVDIFFHTDEFCKDFNKTLDGVQLRADNSKKAEISLANFQTQRL